MLKLGEKIIKDIYLGNKKIAKVFLGDKLVYQAGKPVFLDYIESDGNCYIDTNRPFYANNTYEFSYYTTSTENFAFLGCMNDVNGNLSTQGFDFLLNNDGFFYTRKGFIKGLVRVTVATDRTKVHSYKFCGTQSLALFDETNVWNSNLSSEYWQSDLNIILFKSNRGGTLSASKQVRILNYSVKDESGELVQDLRPCVDPKGIVCMYDMVTKKYFYNQDTGTLTAGNVIKFVDYVEFDEASYIDTEILPKGLETTVRYDFAPLAINTLSGIFGSRVAVSNVDYMFFMYPAKKSLRPDWGGYIDLFYPVEVNKRYLIETKIGEVFINGESVKTYQPKNDTSDYPFYIGTFNNSGSAYKSCQQKVYGCQFFESDVLVGDFKPCVVAGEACFYDMVTGKLFTNAGTGTLKASGRFVKSILFDGASWIDTGINKQSCTIECTVKLESTDYRQFLCGWSHIGGYYIAVDTSNRFELGSSAIVTNSNATELSNVVAEHTKTEMILTVNGNYAKRTKQVQTEPDKNYWLGNINSTSYSAPIKGQVRGHKFKNADGVLIQDLRPYVDENGTACFKDIVTGKLFYNQGTGKLEYTE